MLVWTQENVWNRVLLERGTNPLVGWIGYKSKNLVIISHRGGYTHTYNFVSSMQ